MKPELNISVRKADQQVPQKPMSNNLVSSSLNEILRGKLLLLDVVNISASPLLSILIGHKCKGKKNIYIYMSIQHIQKHIRLFDLLP